MRSQTVTSQLISLYTTSSLPALPAMGRGVYRLLFSVMAMTLAFNSNSSPKTSALKCITAINTDWVCVLSQHCMPYLHCGELQACQSTGACGVWCCRPTHLTWRRLGEGRCPKGDGGAVLCAVCVHLWRLALGPAQRQNKMNVVTYSKLRLHV